ncbi:hypothetical protein [Lysinibacillus sphaericus]|uniref:hypothetical protein n=1 Tax=Lysinibacillus sphaericus TaxID=1421 RepID=UPI001910E2E8|nr:hypothetical protein [Lysinibacillus sphaericus]QPA54977.1 hypothetical protein INQ53_02720 [Lysinibacillus sphaericus]
MEYYNLKDASDNYIEVVAQAMSLYGLFSRRKKLRTLEFFNSKLNEEDFEVEELAKGYIIIGSLYEEIKEYESAAFYFNKRFSLAKNIVFPYESNFKKILKAFLKADRKDLYDYWRSDFIKRSLYDKKINKFKKRKDRVIDT